MAEQRLKDTARKYVEQLSNSKSKQQKLMAQLLSSAVLSAPGEIFALIGGRIRSLTVLLCGCSSQPTLRA
ncbi:unnamed protein product [Gongylonema pulchrum]|uniref:ATP-binding protein n=1 Tax=Gongylonema pulchrum TaxID=637853 RepID=A0A183DLE5_9BILA|nr:unnamed protein product [Gongylonema pulchrum]